MSALIKRTVEPTIERLKRYLDDLPSPLYEDPESMTPSACWSYLKSAKLAVAQIKRAIELLEKQNDRWIDLISSLEGEKLEKEQKIYDEMADDPEGLLNVLDRATEAVVQLETDIKEVGNIRNNKRRIKTSRSFRQQDIANSREDTFDYRQMDKIENCVNEFYSIWTRECKNLQESTRQLSRRNKYVTSREPEADEIVIVAEKNAPVVGKWRLGRIIAVMREKNGVVLNAMIRMARDDFSNTMSNVKLPISRLYPLELRAAESLNTTRSDTDSDFDRKQIEYLMTGYNENTALP
uniref:DUF5641 domain-containing protein n=1 Tax=Syphacia muris TaxID=451379 RepID=A0A0N5AQD2_9BILA